MGTRTRSTAIVLAALLCAVPITGCKIARPKNVPSPVAQAAQRRGEAIKLAEQAFKSHKAGRLEKAEIQYREAIIFDDSMPATWNNLGELLLSQGFYQDAVQAFSQASSLAPQDPRPEYNIGVTYQTAGWSVDAIKHYDNALARDEHYRPALRGVIKAAAEVGIADRSVHNWIRKGLLTETDPVWREFYSTQRFRVEAALDDERYDP